MKIRNFNLSISFFVNGDCLIDLNLLAISILRYFNKAKPSEVFISVASEEKEKNVKSMDLTRNEVRNVKSELEKAESLGSGNRKL